MFYLSNLIDSRNTPPKTIHFIFSKPPPYQWTLHYTNVLYRPEGGIAGHGPPLQDCAKLSAPQRSMASTATRTPRSSHRPAYQSQSSPPEQRRSSKRRDNFELDDERK